MESSTPMTTTPTAADRINVGIRPTPQAAASSTVALDVEALLCLQGLLAMNNVPSEPEDLVTL